MYKEGVSENIKQGDAYAFFKEVKLRKDIQKPENKPVIPNHRGACIYYVYILLFIWCYNSSSFGITVFTCVYI